MDDDPMERDVEKLQEIIRNQRLEISLLTDDGIYQTGLLRKAYDKVKELEAERNSAIRDAKRWEDEAHRQHDKFIASENEHLKNEAERDRYRKALEQFADNGNWRACVCSTTDWSWWHDERDPAKFAEKALRGE